MWTSFDITQAMPSGTYRFTVDYPGMIQGFVPDVTPPVSTQVLGYLFTLTSYNVDEVNKQVQCVIDVTDLSASPQAVPAAQYLPNPYAPTVRYGGGWVKPGDGMTSVPSGAAPPTATPQFIPVVGILAGVGVLIGVVAIYMSLNKVEKLTSNPTVEIAVIAAAAVALFLVVKNLKAGP